MARLLTLFRKVWLGPTVLLIVVVVLKMEVHTLFGPAKRRVNITTQLPARRNADTLTLLLAAQSQEETTIHTRGWRNKIMQTLGMDGRAALPIKVPVDLSSKDWNNLNLMKLPMFDFLPNFKNPCWRESYKPKVACGMARKRREEKRYPVDFLRCLPYFYIIGQPKCGTTDLYGRLNLHPDVVASHVKESFWLERLRFSSECSSINTYLDIQKDSTTAIDRNYITDQNGQRYHNKITGDGTVDIMWDNAIWPLLPGNEGCKEPCVTNADLVHHLYPQAKIIISFRNPVERVYSDFLYEATWLHYNISKQHFHKEVLQEIDKFRDCLKTNTTRFCVYKGSHENSITTKVRLRQGLYSVHLSDWLRVFHRHQIHIIKFEDYIKNIEQEMKLLFRFLDLRELTGEEMERVLNSKIGNTRKKRARAVGSMLDETKHTLRNFYKHYNKELATLLDDDRFLWE